mgnify:CR=1 FL=1
MKDLSYCLSKNKWLIELNLSGSNIHPIQFIFFFLKKKIHIVANKMENEGAIELGRAVAIHPKLRTLRIQGLS